MTEFLQETALQLLIGQVVLREQHPQAALPAPPSSWWRRCQWRIADGVQDCVQKLKPFHRLEQITRYSKLLHSLDFLGIGRGGQHQDLQILESGIAANPLSEREPVHAGHLAIDES